MATQAGDHGRGTTASTRASARPPRSLASLWLVLLAAWALIRAAFVVAHAVTPSGRVPLSFLLLQGSSEEVQRYADLASAWLSGAALPGSAALLPLVTLPRLLAGDFAGYRLGFALQMVVIDLVTLLLLRAWSRWLGAGRTIAAAALYLVASGCLGSLLVQRFDAALGLGALLMLTLLVRRAPDRHVATLVRVVAAVGLVLAELRGFGHPEALLWIAAPVALVAVWPGTPATFGWAAAVAFGLTGVLAQLLGPELAQGERLASLLRGLRALAVGAAVIVAVAPQASGAVVARARTRLAVVSRLPVARLVLVAVFAWTAVASLSPVIENDLWWLMRVGKDVLAQRQIPTVDLYSATAAGQPFHAHEWLAGVAFYWLAAFTRGRGLSVLQALLALACAGLLVASVPRERRRSVVFVPALLAALYVVAFRIDLRPHVLSLVGLSYLTWALERWRRGEGRRPLLALVPLQILWVNLHGEAWLVPVLLGAVAAGAMLESWRWTPADDPRPLRGRDAAFLAALATGTALASLCNPYGARAAAFAFHMGSGQRFMMKDVAEWQPTLSIFATHDHPFWAFIVLLVALWGGLVLRGRAVSAADAALAIVATVLGLRCVRFTAELAVLTLPLVVRTLDAVLAAWNADALRLRRPLFDAGLVGLLLAGTASYGYAFSAVNHRKLGIGLGGDLPYAHVDLMRRLDVHGVVFNDYGSGGLISFHLYPKVRPVMDSRIEVFGPALYAEYSQALDGPDAFDRYVERHGVNLVLLAITPRSLPVLEHLETTGRWQLVSGERDHALMKLVGKGSSHVTVHAPASPSE